MFSLLGPRRAQADVLFFCDWGLGIRDYSLIPDP